MTAHVAPSGLFALAVLAIATNTAVAQGLRDWRDLAGKMVDQEIAAAGVTNERVIRAMRDDAAARVRAAQPAAVGVLRHGPADRRPADDLAAVHRRLHDRRRSTRSRPTACSRSAPAAATRRPCSARWSRDVYTIEIVEPLGRRAARTLKKLGYNNVFVKVGDGYQGWPEHAPFDKIIVTCSPEKVPQPLVDQLRDGGLMIVPVGERYQQNLYLFRKAGDKLESEALQGHAVRADDRRGGVAAAGAARPVAADDRQRQL